MNSKGERGAHYMAFKLFQDCLKQKKNQQKQQDNDEKKEENFAIKNIFYNEKNKYTVFSKVTFFLLFGSVTTFLLLKSKKFYR
jgi:hypothetical protein